jgi:hypothetical protein
MPAGSSRRDARDLDWTLDDPAGKTVDDARLIRYGSERRVRGSLDELGVPAQH